MVDIVPAVSAKRYAKLTDGSSRGQYGAETAGTPQEGRALNSGWGKQETKERRQEMSVKDWEEKVLAAPGAPARVAAIEEELRVAMGLTALREQVGLSQRALARLMGVSQPASPLSSARPMSHSM